MYHSSRLSGPSQGRRVSVRSQAGLATIEVMTAIVLFLIGILGVVGMQAQASQLSNEARLKAQAAHYAAELIAEMWTVAPSARERSLGSRAHGARYTQWLDRLQNGPVPMPGAIAHPPTVSVTENHGDGEHGQSPAISEVTVTIYWQRDGAPINQYVTTARIPDPQS